MKLPSKRIAEALCKNGVVSKEDEPLYEFGLHEVEITFLNVITDLILGIILGIPFQCVLFLVIYIPIRRYAGGYHAKTELRCYAISTVLVLIALCTIRIVSDYIEHIVLFPIFLLSSLIIFLLAPVDSANKPIDAVEHLVFRQYSRWILVIHWGIAVVAEIISFGQMNTVIVCADTLLAVMLILGVGKNHIEK